MIKNIAFSTNQLKNRNNTAKNLSFSSNSENLQPDQPDQLELALNNLPEAMKPFFPDAKEIKRKLEIYNKLNDSEKAEITDFIFDKPENENNSYELLKDSKNITKEEKQTLRELAVNARDKISENISKLPEEEQQELIKLAKEYDKLPKDIQEKRLTEVLGKNLGTMGAYCIGVPIFMAMLNVGLAAIPVLGEIADGVIDIGALLLALRLILRAHVVSKYKDKPLKEIILL